VPYFHVSRTQSEAETYARTVIRNSGKAGVIHILTFRGVKVTYINADGSVETEKGFDESRQTEEILAAKLAKQQEDNRVLKNKVAKLNRDFYRRTEKNLSENKLVSLVRDLSFLLKEAQDHIENQLQPQFVALAHGNPVDGPEDWDDYAKLMRFATWYHNSGKEDLEKKIQDVLEEYS
jgi:hypothetical protein